MRRLASGDIQVLVGTQVVAKGLDLPSVTLVGVVLADVGIYRPDFRAGERAFGLLCQVAGRAGRGPDGGRVIIQTYNPDHYAVAAAADQDYHALFQTEIIARNRQGNPPFNRLVRLLYQDANPTTCQRQAITAARLMRERIECPGPDRRHNYRARSGHSPPNSRSLPLEPAAAGPQPPPLPGRPGPAHPGRDHRRGPGGVAVTDL